MTTLVRTDHIQRIHLYVADDEVAALDCYLVQLPPYSLGVPLLVHHVGVSMEALWVEAVEVVALLRAQPHKPLFPASVFVPFGVVTARSLDAVQREQGVRREMMIGECDDRERERLERMGLEYSQQQHKSRVQALCRALDLMNGAPLPIGTCNWPPVRH